MAEEAEAFERKRKTCLAKIRLHPGIQWDRLKIATDASDNVLEQWLKEFEAEALIRVEPVLFADRNVSIRQRVRYFAADHAPKRSLFQPANRNTGVSTYIDPALKGAWKPGDARPCGDVLTTTTWRQPMNQSRINPFTGEKQAMPPTDSPEAEIERYRQKQDKKPLSEPSLSPVAGGNGRRSPAECRTAIRNALSLMVERGEIWPMSYVCKRAAVVKSYFNNNPDMRTEYEEALREVQEKCRTEGEAEAMAAIDAVNAELDALESQEETSAPPIPVVLEPEVDRQAIEEAQFQAKLSAQAVVELAAEKDQLEQRLQALGERLNKLERLEQRAEELEKHNQQLQQQITQQNDTAVSVAWLQQKHQQWIRTLQRIEDDERRLQVEKRNAVLKVALYREAIAEETGEPLEPAIEWVVQSNGNGKALVGVE